MAHHMFQERDLQTRSSSRASHSSHHLISVICSSLTIIYVLTLAPSADSKSLNEKILSECGHDSYEPNNFRARARNLSRELQHTREVEANLCHGDKDWYIVWLNRGELAEFNVVTPIDKPPRIKVFAPRKRKPNGISRRLTPGHRQVRIYAKQSGRYRVLLEGGGEARTRYHLYLRRLQPMGI